MAEDFTNDTLQELIERRIFHHDAADLQLVRVASHLESAPLAHHGASSVRTHDEAALDAFLGSVVLDKHGRLLARATLCAHGGAQPVRLTPLRFSPHCRLWHRLHRQKHRPLLSAPP